MKFLERDAIDFDVLPDRLNLGCGHDKRDGYINIDFDPRHQPDLVADVSSLSAMPENAFAEILAIDILEHLPRTATKRVLLQWNRLLKTGGILRLRVPDIVAAAKMFDKPGYTSLSQHELLIQCLYGTQAYTGDFHHTSFTPLILKSYLELCGFRLRAIKLVEECMLLAEAEKMRVVSPQEIDDFSALVELGIGDEEFITSAYQAILGRTPDREGLDFYASSMKTGALSRQQFIDTLIASDERMAYRQRMAE